MKSEAISAHTLEQFGLYKELALGVFECTELARQELMRGSEDKLTGMEFMKLIRATYGDGQRHANMGDQLEADAAAINRALNAGGDDFLRRLIAKARG